MEQLVVDGDAAYVPARQLAQTEADAAEYVPAAQAPVSAVWPVVAQYEPALHEVHAEKPVDT